jgi:MFS family permease
MLSRQLQLFSSARAAYLRPAAELLEHEAEVRVFFLAHAQSSLGTGAAYVGLLLLAYDRFESAWAIALVLLADFLPTMLLGPLLGAAADRWSRRRCAVVADIVRAVAFVGLGLVGGFGATLALALLAGTGTALFRPAVLASLPGLVARERLAPATSLYGALADFGHTGGPALAAVLLLFTTPEALMLVNGASFAVSALLLSRLSFGGRSAGTGAPRRGRLALAREAGDGLRATAGMVGVRTVIAASSAVVLFAGLFNVGELLLARDELDAGGSGFSILVGTFGLGVIAGSLSGSRGGELAELKRRFLGGLLVVGLAFVASGVAPVYAFALGAFALAGFGNGLVLVHERLLLQSTVPDALMARVFGVRDTLGSWAFTLSFVAAGAIASLLGTRPLFLLAGGGALLVWAGAWAALRRHWREPGDTGAPEAPAEARIAAEPSWR